MANLCSCTVCPNGAPPFFDFVVSGVTNKTGCIQQNCQNLNGTWVLPFASFSPCSWQMSPSISVCGDEVSVLLRQRGRRHDDRDFQYAGRHDPGHLPGHRHCRLHGQTNAELGEGKGDILYSK